MSDMICEQHPWMDWPHDACAGPGMPRDALEDLHKRAQLISNADFRAFRRLLFAARDNKELRSFTEPLDDHVPTRKDYRGGEDPW